MLQDVVTLLVHEVGTHPDTCGVSWVSVLLDNAGSRIAIEIAGHILGKTTAILQTLPAVFPQYTVLGSLEITLLVLGSEAKDLAVVEVHDIQQSLLCFRFQHCSVAEVLLVVRSDQISLLGCHPNTNTDDSLSPTVKNIHKDIKI